MKNTNNPTPVPKPPVTYQLRKMPAIAPQGLVPGVFSDITVEKQQNASQNECTYLKVLATLDKANPQGQPYQLEKGFNLDGRGLTSFQAYFASWAQRELTDEELDEFKPDVLMKNQPAIFQIEHRGAGKKRSAVITGFLPANSLEQAEN